MSLDGRLDVDADEREVRFDFTVTNAGDAPVDLRFRSGQVADVAVLAGGEVVWRWSAGRGFTQALVEHRLAPGASETASMTWPDPEPGEYEAVASLAAEGTAVEARARFSV